MAGDQREGLSVPRGYCARINTGAPVPMGCDAVVQVEDTKIVKKTALGEEQEILVPAVQSGNDIRPIGSDIDIGNVRIMI